MKKKFYISLFGALSLALAGCADLGFGVDADGGAPDPYWYGNGYLGGTYWNTPVWNYGPIYNMTPPPPPLIGGKPVPVRPPQTIPRPPQNRPSGTNPGTIRPGNNQGSQGGNQGNVSSGGNRVPTHIDGVQRPGNGGLPSNNSRR